jgi:tripartite-type tricarboxylate transporter receptor subunit TctC
MHRLLVLALICALWSTTNWAQPYPSKPIRLLVSDSAGGLADTIARILGNGLGEVVGQRIIIENRAGAASNIGALVAAKSPPDGYTIYQMPQTLAVNATLYTNLQYDMFRDFLPIMRTGSSPGLVVVHPALPVKNVPDLVRLAKSKPGSLTFASAGTGAPTFMAGELFKKITGINMLHVPYRGGGEAITAVVTGETPVYFAPLPVAKPHAESGRLRALAVTSTERVASMPQVPTVAEQGYPAYETGFWYGLVVPVKTPNEIIATINTAMVKTLKLPDVAKRLNDVSFTTVGDQPDDFAKFLKAEVDKWGKIVRELGLKAN